MPKPPRTDQDVIDIVQQMAPEPDTTEADVAATTALLDGLQRPPLDPGLAPPDVTVATMATLVSTVERLMERVDRGEREAATILKGVLEQHGNLLRQALSPENRLHPDKSDYNPLGERDHPRPRLKRPCYFLGVPLEQPTLTRDEIDLLNSIPGPLELTAKQWRVAFLRDGGGGEALYISVPFKSFDDLRSIEGGWQRVLRDLLGTGTRPQNADLLLERLAAMQEQIDRLTAAAVPPATT